MAQKVEIGHERALTLDEVSAVAAGAAVTLAPATRALLAERRAQIEAYVAATAQPGLRLQPRLRQQRARQGRAGAGCSACRST